MHLALDHSELLRLLAWPNYLGREPFEGGLFMYFLRRSYQLGRPTLSIPFAIRHQSSPQFLDKTTVQNISGSAYKSQGLLLQLNLHFFLEHRIPLYAAAEIKAGRRFLVTQETDNY